MSGTTPDPTKPSWFKRNEIPRKVLHGSIAVISTILFWCGVQFSQVTPVLIAMLIPIATLEYLRFTFPHLNRLYIKVVGHMMRPSEKENKQVNGVIWYLVGLITVFSIFPKDVGLLSIYLLSWADLSASTVGRAYGKYTPKIHGNKSLAGSIAAFFTGALSTIVVYRFLFAKWTELNPPSTIQYNEHLSSLSVYGLSMVMGITAAVSELFPIIDDNLSIPIICAIVQFITIKATTLPYNYGVLD